MCMVFFIFFSNLPQSHKKDDNLYLKNTNFAFICFTVITYKRVFWIYQTARKLKSSRRTLLNLQGSFPGLFCCIFKISHCLNRVPIYRNIIWEHHTLHLKPPTKFSCKHNRNRFIPRSRTLESFYKKREDNLFSKYAVCLKFIVTTYLWEKFQCWY